jgi:pre-mRNA-splicing factor ATP-dependent RNA helicase DHX15/PRP43
MSKVCPLYSSLFPHSLTLIGNPADMHDKNWTWTNYLSARALAQADNVRTQLQRTMERFEVELVSLQDEKKLWFSVRQALVCGFFMQVAHKEGDKGNYLTVKDNQVRFRPRRQS